MRRAFTVIELMIVVLIISILAAIAWPQWVRVRTMSQERTCKSTQETIERAKQVWASQEGKLQSDTPDWPDLVPRFLRTQPLCPARGTYEINAVSTHCSCDKHPYGS